MITLEDAAELRLRQDRVVGLESRPASVEGPGEVTIRDLLRSALRMRPDRIVIGEVRGREALDLLTALNTGHDGALSTVDANSPADALRRLEILAMMAGIGLPLEAIREQLRRGIELVAHLARSPQGARRSERGTAGEELRRTVPTARRFTSASSGRPAQGAGGLPLLRTTPRQEPRTSQKDPFLHRAQVRGATTDGRTPTGLRRKRVGEKRAHAW